MDMVNGAPLHLLNLIALLGAATLVGASVTVPFRQRVAAKIGLTFAVALLCAANCSQRLHTAFNLA